MGYLFVNPNPRNLLVGDCVIRAISIAEGRAWDDIFLELMLKSYDMKDVPTANSVWASYLKDLGYTRFIIPNTCPDCYTVKEFAADNPIGIFILATGTHVVTVYNGEFCDTWDSGDEVPIYYFVKETDNA